MGEELRGQLQESVSQHGVEVERLEVRQIGLPSDMQRVMASEAEAGVQARANVALSRGEQEASRNLVEAGKDTDPVSIHLSYLQTVGKRNQEMAYVCPFPYDIMKAFLDQRSREEQPSVGKVRRRRNKTQDRHRDG